jgi:SAM-dependent methyltransferase
MTPSPTNTPANRYGSIAAEIYDLDKAYFALPDTAFHLETLAGVAGPILEPACGSGRTLVPLLEAGHDAAGFDTSEEMLEQCRARCAAAGFAPDLTRQGFADFAYDRAFAAIVVPVGSFTLIGEFAVAMAVLGRFRDHLAAGGLLIVDIQSLAFLANTREDRRSWTAANGDLLTVEGKQDSIDWLRQRDRHTCRYERWRDNRLIEAQLEPMIQRHWGLEEFTLALMQSGFGEIEVTGSYARGRSPRSSDRTLTFAARKA